MQQDCPWIAGLKMAGSNGQEPLSWFSIPKPQSKSKPQDPQNQPSQPKNQPKIQSKSLTEKMAESGMKLRFDARPPPPPQKKKKKNKKHSPKNKTKKNSPPQKKKNTPLPKTKKTTKKKLLELRREELLRTLKVDYDAASLQYLGARRHTVGETGRFGGFDLRCRKRRFRLSWAIAFLFFVFLAIS